MTRPDWTRLADDPVWGAAAHAHRRRYGRIYHDWDRVLRIYYRAQRDLRLPYDRALDLAILSHSAVIDLGGDRRPRSAAWLRSHAGPDEPVEAACRLILSGPYRDLSDPRLPLLELSDLGDPDWAQRAIGGMREQVSLLTRMSPEDIEPGIERELARIRRALRAALPRIGDPSQRELAERILRGAEQKYPDKREGEI